MTQAASHPISAPEFLLSEVLKAGKSPLLSALLHKKWTLSVLGQMEITSELFPALLVWLHMWQTLQLFPLVNWREEAAAVST